MAGLNLPEMQTSYENCDCTALFNTCIRCNACITCNTSTVTVMHPDRLSPGQSVWCRVCMLTIHIDDADIIRIGGVVCGRITNTDSRTTVYVSAYKHLWMVKPLLCAATNLTVYIWGHYEMDHIQVLTAALNKRVLQITVHDEDTYTFSIAYWLIGTSSRPFEFTLSTKNRVILQGYVDQLSLEIKSTASPGTQLKFDYHSGLLRGTTKTRLVTMSPPPVPVSPPATASPPVLVPPSATSSPPVTL